jgi:hypothetical protein
LKKNLELETQWFWFLKYFKTQEFSGPSFKKESLLMGQALKGVTNLM